MPSQTRKSVREGIQLSRRGSLLNAPTDYPLLFHIITKMSCGCKLIPRQSGINLHTSNYFQTLLSYAEFHFNLGRSVIPLLGDADPSRPKVPAVPWAAFQNFKSSLAEQEQWFSRHHFAGLGIVTGRVSQLVVLDFDSEAIFKDFAAQYPDLLETHTVRSANRQLPHLYFRLPADLYLESHKGQGIDVLSNGRYVVAPPTVINGQAYKISRGGMPKTLTERDIRRIQAFLNAHKAPVPSIPIPPTVKSAANLPYQEAPETKPSAYNLQSYYRHLAAQGGRNEALFRASLYARNTGWTAEETQNCLAVLHSKQLGMNPHKKETELQRHREALKTIRSAYSRPPQMLKTQMPRQYGQVPNSIREALLKQKMTYVLRTYEGLLQKGIQAGQRITNKEAVQCLKGLVGRDSVLKALKAGQGSQLFFSPPVNPPDTANAVATENALKPLNKCYLLVRKNQYKPQGGRPEHVFRMPSIEDLCAILGVKNSVSDPLEQADLASAHQTRIALHRELIKRRPGQYSCHWLGQRLGVSKRTIRAYNRLIPIQSRSMFTESSIYWNTIDRLPFDEPLSGAFIITKAGKKYPALRFIASNLLVEGQSIRLKQQMGNFYWYGDHEPILVRKDIEHQADLAEERREAFIAQQVQIQPVKEKPLPVPKPTQPLKPKPRLPKNLNAPLKNQPAETQAQQLYSALNQTNDKQLSLANARRLVLTYEADAITRALDLIKQRQPVSNPVGFMRTVLRSSAQAQ